MQAPQAVEWNILKVNADDVWAAGYTGQGAVVGGQDTGYDWDHPALINQYRGWNGSSADHNYNWHDAIHSGTQHHLSRPTRPRHVMITATARTPWAPWWATMAPATRSAWRPAPAGSAAATWTRGGTPATYTECYQWFIAPTDLNGENPRPDLAPDVINNSWSCPTSEGCTDPNVLLAVVENVRAAGILTAHSAGNSGSACSTINTPAAIYDLLSLWVLRIAPIPSPAAAAAARSPSMAATAPSRMYLRRVWASGLLCLGRDMGIKAAPAWLRRTSPGWWRCWYLPGPGWQGRWTRSRAIIEQSAVPLHHYPELHHPRRTGAQ